MSKKRFTDDDDNFATLDEDRAPAANPEPEPMAQATEPEPTPSLACPRCQSGAVMLWKLKTHICRNCGNRFEAELQ